MNTYPLVRVKGSNEHLMAGVFAVALLYSLPAFINNPSELLVFLLIGVVSLVVDTALNFIRYKRPVCAVSASVTAVVYFALTSGAPLWGRLLGAIAALVLGKHLWGGTGKNPLNPALVGVMLVSIAFQVQPLFGNAWMIAPAMLLSLPFILVRPYAAFGFMAGMVGSLVIKGSMDIESLGLAVFMGSLVLTDPVTVSGHPLVGLLGGVAVGFIPQQLSGSIFFVTAGILLFNLLSFLTESLIPKAVLRLPKTNKLDKLFPIPASLPFFDLTQEQPEPRQIQSLLDSPENLECNEILKRIDEAGVFGLGGAAFPTIRKIRAVMASKEPKHLIINGVECDPGLIHDYWLVRHAPEDVLAGVALLKRCISFDSVSLAVKSEKGLPALDGISLIKVPDLYPAGAEKLLIQQVIGQKLPFHSLPAERGILVLNVGTLQAVFEAVIKKKKADSRLITIADFNSKAFSIARVKLGMPLHRVIAALGLPSGHLFTGGGAMQCRLAMEEDVVEGSTNFLAISPFPKYKESPLCSRCGSCRTHCPSGLKVDKIADLADESKWQDALSYHPENCVQCGYCSRVCGAGRNLSVRVKRAKEHVNPLK